MYGLIYKTHSTPINICQIKSQNMWKKAVVAHWAFNFNHFSGNHDNVSRFLEGRSSYAAQVKHVTN